MEVIMFRVFNTSLFILTIASLCVNAAFAQQSSSDADNFYSNCFKSRSTVIDISGRFYSLRDTKNYSRVYSFINYPRSNYTSIGLSRINHAINMNIGKLDMPDGVFTKESDLGCKDKTIRNFCYLNSCAGNPDSTQCLEIDISEKISKRNQIRNKLFRLLGQAVNLAAKASGSQSRTAFARSSLRRLAAEFPEATTTSVAARYTCTSES
jgi:hypothetical protein